MDKATFLRRIDKTIDLTKIPHRSTPHTDKFIWRHFGDANNFISFGREGEDIFKYCVAITFAWGVDCATGADKPCSNPPEREECVSFYGGRCAGTEEIEDVFAEAALTSLLDLTGFVSISFLVDNTTAKTYINDAYIGPTPVTFSLKANTGYTVRLEADGYKTLEFAFVTGTTDESITKTMLDICEGITCPDKCVRTTLYYNGYCSAGNCVYETKENAIECGYAPQMDKATFISKITNKIDLAKIPMNVTDTYRWYHTGFASNFIVWGKRGDDKAVSIAFTWCSAKNANPPTYVECIGFRESVPPGKITDATIEEEIANAALAALPYLVTVTFTAKKEDGTELTGVGVSIDGEKKRTT